jgi:phage shock protein A
MFKQILILMKGHATDQTQAALDGQALTILRQQIRDCAEAITSAKRAVAIAIAQNDQEAKQADRIAERLADLEVRTLSALELGKQELAREAAETIVLLEAERDASHEAQRAFTSEISRLKRILRESENRLRELERGQRIAAATEKTAKLRDFSAGSSLTALKDAEATLARLRTRQKQMELADAALQEMEQSGDPSTVSRKLAEAGCGAPLKHRADDVLKRLSDRLAAKT